MAYTADRRLYVTADGRVVEEGDVAAVALLIGVGGVLSDADAARYGLTGEKAAPAPPANKRRAGRPEDKAR